jgi:peptidoglycan hydrolase-like protein with peptidoglycan-binding domain
MTPVHFSHRSPKAILLLLAALFVVCLAVPSAQAGSASRAPSLSGLHPGEQGPAVRKLQRMLARLGYPVKPDGQFGPHTATMVRTLRADAGLDRSARVTKRFLKILKRAQRGGPGDRRWLGIRRLHVGAQGADVRLLQNALTKLGFPAATDGAFGPATRTSVRMFERAAGLRVDGVLSPREVRTLKRAAKAGTMAGAVSLRTTRSTTSTTSTTSTAGTVAPGTTPAQANQPTGQVAPAPPAVATIGANGLAIAPAGAPAAIVAILNAGNVIAHMPYRFGGGHQSWQDTGYDCSASVSYALHGAGLLDAPLASYDFYNWGDSGPGQWVTIYAKDSHAYMVVAGLRYDTAASKGGGSRWTAEARAPDGYVARHPAGL